MKQSVKRYARLSAAVFAVACGVSAAHAQRNLTWDPSATNPPTDGPGNWDNSSNQWYDPGTNSVVTWDNTAPDNAIFGTGPVTPTATSAGVNVFLNTTSLSVGTITLNTTSNGGFYNILDQEDGAESLTVQGNIIKATGIGMPAIQLVNPITLTSGTHTIALNDTPGDAAELTITGLANNGLTGPGVLTLDNGFNSSGYQQWGTLLLNTDNTYTGGTNIVKGRLVVDSGGALGSGTVVISNQGFLSYGGAGTSPSASVTINNPIVITRNTYTGTDYSDYPDALSANNNGHSTQVLTLNNLTVDSTDARVSANTAYISIPNNVLQGPDVTNGMLTLDGDFAGFINLGGDNSALGGGIQLMGGVEVNVTSLANLGGSTGKLTFNGNATLHPVNGFITSFGSLNVNYSTFNGGIDVDAGQTFTISQNLGAVGSNGSIGERGTGTLVLSGTDILGGTTFWDGVSPLGGAGGGVVDVTGTMTLGSLHLRSPVVNITGSVTTTSGYDSFGQDSNGTSGGPDKATINLTGTGALIEASGDDFNISDNGNTQGTINMYDSSVLTTGGIMFIGKSTGAIGTINQYGGTLTVNRNGNFGFVLADGRNGTPTGYYNLYGGSWHSAGETYVGEGNGGTGFWTQTGGTATLTNWFVIGREGAQGTMDISGGSLTQTDNPGTNFSIGEGSSKVNTLTVEKTGTLAIVTAGSPGSASGELWVGNGGVGVVNVGSATGALTNADATASITVNSWLAVGRNGGTGTLNLYDGTVTQASANWFDVGAGGTGTVNMLGGTLNAFQTYIGETGGGSAVFNISGGAANLGTAVFANSGSVTGTLNLNGGSVTASGFTDGNGGGTGVGKFVFNGGTLLPSADNSNFIGQKVTSVVSTGGAKVNLNGHSIAINSVLTHDTTLGGADGGLNVSGSGTLTLGKANTYTGPTSINGGTTIVGVTGALPTNTAVSISTGTLQLGTSTGLATISSLAITGNGTFDVNNDHVIINYGAGPDPVASIAALLHTGYAGGAWNGAGGITSTAAAATSLSYGVGYADAADAGNPAGLSSGTIEVAYTLLGDADLNHIVNGIDFGIVAANFNQGVSRWDQGDFDYNNIVNGVDFGDLAANFNQGANNASDWAALVQFAEANGLMAEVPEPASLGLLAIGTVGIMARRRRRREV